MKITFFRSRPLVGRIAGYTLVFLLALTVFSYLRFPPDALGAMLKTEVEANGLMKMDFASATLSFPPRLILRNVTLSPAKGKQTMPALNMERLSLTPDIISLVMGGRRVTVDAHLLGGAAVADIKREGKANRGVNVAFRLENIDPDLGPWWESFRWARFSGQLSGTGSFATPGPEISRGTGHLVITLKKGAVTPDKALFGSLSAVQVKSGTAELEFKSGRLNIVKCELDGPQINAKVTGEIIVASTPGFSRLNLNVSAKLSGVLDKKLGPLLSLFPKGSAGAHIIHIGGTVSNPSVH